MIFKGSVNPSARTPGRSSPVLVHIAEAVQASCSAYPLFERKTVEDAARRLRARRWRLLREQSNPVRTRGRDRSARRAARDVRVVSVGVGEYPSQEPKRFAKMGCAKYLTQRELLQKTMEINTQSMDQLRAIMYKNVPTVRISDTFERAADGDGPLRAQHEKTQHPAPARRKVVRFDEKLKSNN